MPRSIRQVLIAAAALTAARALGRSHGERRGRRRRHDGQTGPAESARQATHRGRRHPCAGRRVGAAPPLRQRLGYVLSGAIRSQNSAAGPAKVYRAGESFFEPPDSEHVVSENTSVTSQQACSPSASPMTARS
jgi:quercetin dioxygenase-like cupin family protein